MNNTGKAISSREIHALELNAEYYGVTRLQMMEIAGRSVADIINARRSEPAKITVYAGIGGNGGDGMVAARHLASTGHDVTVVLAGDPHQITRDEVLKNWTALEFMSESVKRKIVRDSAQVPMIEGDVIIDALLGIGVKGSLRPPISQIVETINTMQGFKVAVDLPTGVNADTGAVVDEAVQADLTITFHLPKKGLFQATEYTGELVVSNIGLPREAQNYVGPGDVLLVRKPRVSESHKGDYGRLLIIGGSETFSGAPALAGMAAFRVGVDLVYIATPAATAHDIAAMFPSFITIKLRGSWLSPKNIATIRRFLARSTAVVLGPGLGLHKDTLEAVNELVDMIEAAKIPLLLDADGLKAFARFKHQVTTPLVLTPHTGEYQILTGTTLPQNISRKIENVQTTAHELGATILLKGSTDIISDGKRVKVNKYIHNPGMTVGGTGDVLSGIVGAFLSQGFKPFPSAVAGTFINGAAGDFAVHERGYHILPTDLIEFIPKIIDDPLSHLPLRTIKGST